MTTVKGRCIDEVKSGKKKNLFMKIIDSLPK